MSTNNTSQTLFRFVSLRNPELTETKNNSKFILKSDDITTIFDRVVYNRELLTPKKSKLEYLEYALTNYPTLASHEFYKTEKELEDKYGSIYLAGKSLAQNRKMEVSELYSMISPSNFINKTSGTFVFTNENDLWDNLIYQVISQQNFYVKESIIHILQVFNYVKLAYVDLIINHDNEEFNRFINSLSPEELSEWKENLANAKVVLPDYLFVDEVKVEVPPTFQVDVSKIGSGIIDLENQDEVLANILMQFENSKTTITNDVGKLLPLAQRNTILNVENKKKDKLESLRKEIQKAQSLYKKSYQKAFDLAQKQYQDSIKPDLETYELAVLQAKAALSAEATPAMIELAVKQVVKPEIPIFEFNYQKEMDAVYLQSKLSSKNQKTLGELIGVFTEPNTSNQTANKISLPNADFIIPEDEYQTFDEVLSLIDEKITICKQTIYENTSLESEKMYSVGGVLIPQGKTTSVAPGNYILTPFSNMVSPGNQSFPYDPPIYEYGFNLVMDTGVVGLSVGSMTFTTNTGETAYYADVTNDGSVYYFNDIFYGSFPEADFQMLNSFSAEINFTDGSKAAFTNNAYYSDMSPVSGSITYTKADPGSGGPGTSSSLKFNAKTIDRSSSEWSVLIEFENQSIGISSGNYSGYGSNNITITDTAPSQLTGSAYTFFNSSKIPINANFTNGFTMKGDIVLSDGKTYTMDFPLTKNTTLPLETLTGQYPCTGQGTLTLKTAGSGGDTGSGNNTTTIAPKATFAPTGFGIKRLGIADYLKVEQSTHAYVEGEVANIENIMAREYREKSTRRLSKSENTSTTSSDTEREKLTDTTTATRFDMQTEIAKMQQEATDIGVNANTGYKGEHFHFDLSANYANHRSKEESTRQAVQQAQDITARALDRVVTKVHQERIEKITEEFEENNKHGFDNRTGDKHVVGVYRWVDKLMKNQIFDYGKRLMFEFMVPQPSKFHNLAMQNVTNGILIEKPVDPRNSKDFNLCDYSKITEETIKYWSSKFNVELENKLSKNLSIGKSYSGMQSGNISKIEFFNVKDEIQIQEHYIAKSGLVGFTATEDGDWNSIGFSALIGDKNVILGSQRLQGSVSKLQTFDREFSNFIPVSATFSNYFTGTANFTINCETKPEYEIFWQQKTFNAIIQAYEDALTEYNNKLAEENAKASNIKDANPMYYRQIEQEVLKHNCIAYLTDDSTINKNQVLGKTLYAGNTSATYEVLRQDLDSYAVLAKFMEQAFEWEIMSYNFYPYYWGERDDWNLLYQPDNIDPLFRSFLHSGMARVIVTVKPGFEDAVQFYMSTGRIWNGGEVPVIGDPLYLSIVDELKQTTGKSQGKAWLTRLPTPLTILQAESIGLKVESALPYTHENPDDFEVPSQLITHSNFHNTNAQLGVGSNKKQIQFSWENLSNETTIGDLEHDNLFPRVFSCMGQEIFIDRDANWDTSDSINVLYKALAEKVSYNDGVTAYISPSVNKGLTFVVDTSKVKKFDFRKPGGDANLDHLVLETDGETFIHFQSPKGNGSAMEKISDKNGVHLTDQESDKTLPFSRFLL